MLVPTFGRRHKHPWAGEWRLRVTRVLDMRRRGRGLQVALMLQADFFSSINMWTMRILYRCAPVSSCCVIIVAFFVNSIMAHVISLEYRPLFLHYRVIFPLLLWSNMSIKQRVAACFGAPCSQTSNVYAGFEDFRLNISHNLQHRHLRENTGACPQLVMQLAQAWQSGDLIYSI